MSIRFGSEAGLIWYLPEVIQTPLPRSVNVSPAEDEPGHVAGGLGRIVVLLARGRLIAAARPAG